MPIFETIQTQGVPVKVFADDQRKFLIVGTIRECTDTLMTVSVDSVKRKERLIHG